MKWTETLIPTLRDIPKDAEATSHQLMIRSGMVRKLSSGVYSYLPLGVLALNKIQKIIREEMVSVGAVELLLPALHPAELWKKTGRYDSLGGDKISFENRSAQEFVLGPTHEEVITDLISHNVKSYKELPMTLFQIQTKFRDELRPRFGVIRSKEFIMKDAYSFDTDWEGLDKTYQVMLQAYKNIFKRCHLNVEVVNADPGLMGGNVSHEFMLLADFGEDTIASCTKTDYRSTPELVPCFNESLAEPSDLEELLLIETPGLKTIEAISKKLDLAKTHLMKTIIYVADKNPVACLVRGDHEISELKLKKYLDAKELVLASDEEILKWVGCSTGFCGPVGLKNIRVVGDEALKLGGSYVSGANQNDKHYKGVNLDRDCSVESYGDVRTVLPGERSPSAEDGVIEMKRAMEIGHIFKLGTRYSKPLEARFIDKSGKEQDIIMGCYGIGVNRMVAGAIEQNHDEKGICWPVSIAPALFHMITMNQADEVVVSIANELYEYFKKSSIDVIYDNRNERAGVKFNDADLIGLPYQLIIGSKNAKEGKVELKTRHSGEVEILSVVDFYKRIEGLVL